MQHRDFCNVFVGPQRSPPPGLPENADKVFVQGMLSVVALLLEHQGLYCQKGKIQILCLRPYTASPGRVLQGCLHPTCCQQAFLSRCRSTSGSLLWVYFLPYLLVLDLITARRDPLTCAVGKAIPEKSPLSASLSPLPTPLS